MEDVDVEDVSDEELQNDDNDDGGSEDGDAEKEFAAIKDDDLIQPEKLLEVKSKESHIVHAPYFPLVSWTFTVHYIFASLESMAFGCKGRR